jgi:hypothetical protein
MSVVQSSYSERQRPNTPQTLLLIIDVPGRATDKIVELQNELKQCADLWIKNAEQGVFANTSYRVETDIVEADKLSITRRIR